MRITAPPGVEQAQDSHAAVSFAVDANGEFLGFKQFDGLGAIVNSSRDIISSFPADERDWEAKVEEATRATIAALAKASPMARLAASSHN